MDALKKFEFTTRREIRLGSAVAKPNSLLWVIPEFNIGSGGHLNIFRTIWHLEQMGYESTIALVQPTSHFDAAAVKSEIVEHFFPLKANVLVGEQGWPNCEMVIATGWQTAYPVRFVVGDVKKVYFIQDYEPWFYPMSSESQLTENTYNFGFFGIVVGQWLARRMADDYGMPAHPVSFGVERERYRRLPRRDPHVKRVFFYARPPTPRRAFELGIMVLSEVAKRLPDTQFVLAGWDCSDQAIPFAHEDRGTLGLDELPELYSQCDVALVLSLTNLSLLPLELMACGCTVVSNRGDNVEWLLNEDIAVLVDATTEALAAAMCELLTNDERRRDLSVRAESYARTFTWDTVAKDFEAGLQLARAQPSAQSDVAG